jgi:hypothetical protein
MKRKTFDSILAGAVASALAAALWRFPLLRSALGPGSQMRMEAAKRDLRTILKIEIGFIKKRKKFASLNELVSSGDLGQEMLGRFGYMYSICLRGKSLSASAQPLENEQLPVVHINFFGPGLDPVLANLQEKNYRDLGNQ